LIETGFGEKYLIAPDSVDKHIAYIEEVTSATGRDTPRPVATSRTPENRDILEPQVSATGTDLSRQDATSPDMSRYFAQVERENDFLRRQIEVKDTQIKEMTERARETNLLIGGLQKMLSPLLGAPGERREDTQNDDLLRH
jgi:hypothetical protein